MKRLQAYKFRIEPTGEQQRAMRRIAGTCRFVWKKEPETLWLKETPSQLYAIDPRNTSRTCPVCSHVSAENRSTQAKFECVACGFAEHADLTAAINILRAGHARLACQVNGAIMPSATGTHRSERPHPGVEAVGVPIL